MKLNLYSEIWFYNISIKLKCFNLSFVIFLAVFALVFMLTSLTWILYCSTQASNYVQNKMCDYVYGNDIQKSPSNRIRTSDLRISVLKPTTVLRSTNWAIEGLVASWWNVYIICEVTKAMHKHATRCGLALCNVTVSEWCRFIQWNICFNWCTTHASYMIFYQIVCIKSCRWMNQTGFYPYKINVFINQNYSDGITL